MKILIKDLVLYGYHGVHEHEKKDGQDFIFNISIYINDSRLKDNDRLEDTLSYSDVIREVKKINKSQRCDLLETLSRTVAKKIVSMSGLVENVDVRIEKPHPPIDEKLVSVGVEYSTSRSEVAAGKEDKIGAFLSLGSNMGDREGNIDKALGRLKKDPHIDIIKTSSVYETEPMYVEDQDNFFNIVVEVKVRNGLSPFGLLGLIKGIEHDMGRRSGGKRFGPRIIDIDILYFGDEKIKSDILEIPHPLISERKFVLIPLSEIAPEIEIGVMDIKEYLEKKKLPGRVEKISK